MLQRLQRNVSQFPYFECELNSNWFLKFVQRGLARESFFNLRFNKKIND